MNHQKANGLGEGGVVCMWCGIVWEDGYERLECPKHPRRVVGNRPRSPSFDADLDDFARRLAEIRAERQAGLGE